MILLFDLRILLRTELQNVDALPNAHIIVRVVNFAMVWDLTTGSAVRATC